MPEQFYPSTHAAGSDVFRDVGAWSHDKAENDGSSGPKQLYVEDAKENPKPGGQDISFKTPVLGDGQINQNDNAEAKEQLKTTERLDQSKKITDQ